MKDRAVEIAGFLIQTGWGDAQQTPLQADFSTRRFARLEREGRLPQRAILMDADDDQRTEQFIAIANILRGCEISAPEIYAADAALGLVLMEDFGDRNFGRLIDAGEDARVFYRRAVDVLVHLHKSFKPRLLSGVDLPIFSSALFTTQAELFLDAYIPFTKNREATFEESESFRDAWKETFKGIDSLPQTLMLRDFMPDNLMDLPGRGKWRNVGVLDFQDGGMGPLPYDLASLCEVVRRDAPANLLDDMIDYYHQHAQPTISKGELRRTCRVLSAQRHIRILGIIARAAAKTGKREKLDYMPRIWAYLEAPLQDEALKPVREWINQYGAFQHGGVPPPL